MIKTFRGLIADGAQDTIALHTNDGSTGYRIVKFDIITELPGTTTYESIVKVFTIEQAAVTQAIDFSDQTLVAVGYVENRNQDDHGANESVRIINDQMVFNQDIFITHYDVHSATNVNYYLELEQIKLDLSENTVATLKDIRNVKTQGT